MPSPGILHFGLWLALCAPLVPRVAFGSGQSAAQPTPASKWTGSGKTSSLSYSLNCSLDSMTIQVDLGSLSQPYVYLEKLAHLPVCRPEMRGKVATFRLPLDHSSHRCGTTSVRHSGSGTRVFYHRVVVEDRQSLSRQTLHVQCPSHSPPSRNRRQLTGPGQLVNFTELDLPDNFAEAEILDFTDNITARAPYPNLGLRVRQDGRQVNSSLNVAPGTPLEMTIYLDGESSPVYGLLVSYMKVTDAGSRQQEVILLNGCSIDPYIFGNFETQDGGDSVAAKFRAFKFPESNYVVFVGTVNVCLGQCKGVPCANGALGFGRRRRRSVAHSDSVFEVEMTTVLRVASEQQHRDSLQASGQLPASARLVAPRPDANSATPLALWLSLALSTLLSLINPH